MASDLIERVRERAYQIWEGNGREGNPEEHWLAAEREILGNESAPRDSFSGEAAGRNATRTYDNNVKKFGESGRVAEKVREAKEALEGPEREDLKRAEEDGKRRARGAA
ncbi:MAG TPA: DUF2934 domain-containing protein [Candidatus Binataceae bacterium]|nr:DUF2934 domain-containing protein [Candidatus Binataceae bacterium]